MKLSSRYARVNLLTSLIILLISGMAYYVVIHYILTEDLDKDLVVEEQEIAEYIKLYHALPPAGNFKDQIVAYAPVQSRVKRKFKDTEYRKPGDDDKEPGRSLRTSVMLNNQLYEVTIIKSKVESEDLVQIIFYITLGITGLLLISLALVNRFILNRLWKPFHKTLGGLSAFNIADGHELQHEDTAIDEFLELNRAVKSLTLKVKQDYSDLKMFTDNASHEMMTPLAVMHSKLDLLLQTGTYTESQGELLEDIFVSMSRLARLNQSLLLMAKIENNLIQDTDAVSLDALVIQKSKQFQELLQAEDISFNLELKEKEVVMSSYLADILLNNLVGNAIRHNVPKGKINIRLDNRSLRISNTGKPEPLNPDKIFERFSKDGTSEGMGLGLSIAKQICTYYSYTLSYQYIDSSHIFTVAF